MEADAKATGNVWDEDISTPDLVHRLRFHDGRAARRLTQLHEAANAARADLYDIATDCDRDELFYTAKRIRQVADALNTAPKPL